MKNALAAWMLAAAALGSAQGLTPPPHTAQSILVMDATTGQVLYSVRPDQKRYPASTTKIMTALLALERLKPEDVLTAPSNIRSVGGSSLRLQPGEKLTVRDLTYAMLLRSANDACVTVAQKISGSVPNFSRLMNQRAAELGATNTRFANPHGLPNANHFTTASDLARIARAALKNPEFVGISSQQSHVITRSINAEDTLLENTNRFMREDNRSIGLKTGWTNAAGRCFVGAVRQKDTVILTVILKSEEWVTDQRAVTRWVDNNFQSVPIAKKGEVIAELPLEGGARSTVKVAPSRDLTLLLANGTAPEIIWPKEPVKAPIYRDMTVGEALVRVPGVGSVRIPLKATETVRTPNVIGSILTHPITLSFAGIIGALALLRAYLRHERRKRRRMRHLRPIGTQPRS